MSKLRKEFKNLPCLVQESRRNEFLMVRGKAAQDQAELVGWVQEEIGNLELAGWQQILTHWQGNQGTTLVERGWERGIERD